MTMKIRRKDTVMRLGDPDCPHDFMDIDRSIVNRDGTVLAESHECQECLYRVVRFLRFTTDEEISLR